MASYLSSDPLGRLVLDIPTDDKEATKYLTLGRVQDMWPTLRLAQDRVPVYDYSQLPRRPHKSVEHKRLMRAFQDIGLVSEMWRTRHDVQQVAD